MSATANIAQHLPSMAALQPHRAALKLPKGRTGKGDIDYLTLSFAQLDAEVDAWALHLRSAGVQPGDRVLVMVKQGLPLIAAAFALFKTGAVPIVIDPGMGLKSFLACVARSRPRVLLGIPLAQWISRLARKSFRSVERRVTVSSSPLARRFNGSVDSTIHFTAVERGAADLAAILFTSGSTGAPKGVCYEHGMFEAQVRSIRSTYGIEPGEIDLPMLPVFALFNPALGMTTVVPEIDPSRPGRVDPAKIIQAVQQEQVTNSFGSPTLWGKIGDHCIAKNITLPSMRRVLCAGAPVPSTLWEKSRRFLTHGRLHSPYGATEALPVSSVSVEEVDTSSTRGACVGKPADEVEAKIIALTDSPLARLEDARELPSGEIGEIVVRGPVVTKSYDALPEATACAKIRGENGQIWHRMGDTGYRDSEGRLWFCGRKVERLETADGLVFTEPCEQVFRPHPGVARCALIGLGARGSQVPALVVQPATKLSEMGKRELAAALRQRAVQHAHTAAITRFYFHSSFPVDVRHNAKIHRLTLARWAATATAYECP